MSNGARIQVFAGIGTFHACKLGVMLDRTQRELTDEDIRKHSYVLTPGRCVGAEATEDGDEPFEAKMARLTAELKKQMEEAAELDAAIWVNLEGLGDGR